MGGIIGRQVVIYVFYVKKAGNSVVVNRTYDAPDDVGIHLGAMLDCYVIGDRILTFRPVKPFEADITVTEIRRDSGEKHAEVAPKFVNDGAICDVIVPRGEEFSLGKHRVSAVYDTPHRIIIKKIPPQ